MPRRQHACFAPNWHYLTVNWETWLLQLHTCSRVLLKSATIITILESVSSKRLADVGRRSQLADVLKRAAVALLLPACLIDENKTKTWIKQCKFVTCKVKPAIVSDHQGQSYFYFYQRLPLAVHLLDKLCLIFAISPTSCALSRPEPAHLSA